MPHQPNSSSLMRICFLCVIPIPLVSTTFAQNAAPVASRNKELSKIDSRATKVDQQFIREAIEIAGDYEKAGDVARAVDYMHAMSLIKPGMPAIESKLKKLRNEVLAANGFSFTLQPATTWGKPVAYVKEGKPFRVAAQGDYRLLLNADIGPDGFPQDDFQSDLIKDAPLGKLMGVIVEVPGKAAKSTKSSKSTKSTRKGMVKEKEPEPFEVGAERLIKPQHTGYLYLKVNLPAESDPRGSFQVQLSGYVLAPNGQNVGK